MTNRSSWSLVAASVRTRIRADIAAQLPLACVICGHVIPAGAPFHTEHIVSVDQGGPLLDLANLGPAHPACNLAKGARSGDTRAYTAPWAASTSH